MDRHGNISNSFASEAVAERARAEESAQRASKGEDVLLASNGDSIPTSTSLRRVAISSLADRSPSSSSNTSPRIPVSLSNSLISPNAESGGPSKHLEGSAVPSNVRLTHKDSFGFQRRTSSIIGSPGKHASSANAGGLPVDTMPVDHTTRTSLELYQDSKESIDAAGDYFEVPDVLKGGAGSVADASGSPPGAVVAGVDEEDATSLASRTKRKLSLGGGASVAPLPGARRVSLQTKALVGVPMSEDQGSYDASRDMAVSRSPLSHTRNIPDLPLAIPPNGSAIPKANGGAKTPASWTVPASDGQSVWTVEAEEDGRDAAYANTRSHAPMVKQESTTSDRDTPRRADVNRTRIHANGEADDGVHAKEYASHSAPSSSLTTATSSRPLAARQHRSQASKTGPQLPSALNVLPASPPAMYWSKVPVHGSVPRRSFRAHSACLSDEVMWLFGGCDAKGCFRDLWCFDTETMCWSKPKATGDLPPPRRAHSATMVDKRLYVFAGGDGPYYFNDLFVFDTIALRWTKPDVFGQPPSARRAHTSNYYNGQLIIFGGGNGVGALNDVYSLDLSDINRLEWRKVPCTGKVPIGRGYHTSNLVDGKLIVIGGSDGHMSFNDIHILRLDTKVWYQIKTDETHNRLGHTATQVGSYLFIVGGHDSHSYTPDILTLNLVNLQWEPRSVCGKKPPGRGYHQAWLRDSRLFVHGGFDGREIYDDLYHIDLSAASYIPQITSFSVEPEQVDDE